MLSSITSFGEIVNNNLISQIGLPKSFDIKSEVFNAHHAAKTEFNLHLFKIKQYDYGDFQGATEISLLTNYYNEIKKDFEECDLVKRLISEKTEHLEESLTRKNETIELLNKRIEELEESVKNLTVYESYVKIAKELKNLS